MTRSSFAQIRHNHEIYHEAGPTRKVLRALTMTGLGIVLFPGEASPFPLPIDILYQVSSKLHINLPGLLLVRTSSLSNVLRNISILAVMKGTNCNTSKFFITR